MISQHLMRYLLHFGFFQLLFILSTMVITSLGVFFHFLLEHEMGAVETWINLNLWEISFLAKLVSFLLIGYSLKLRLYHLPSLKDLFKLTPSGHEDKIIVLGVFIFFLIFYLQDFDFKVQSSFSFFYSLVSYIFSLLWFALDFITLKVLLSLYAPKNSEKKYFLLISIGLYLIGFSLATQSPQGLWVIALLHFMTLYFIIQNLNQPNLSALIYLAFVAAPLSSLTGLDPIWGSSYSLWGVSQGPVISRSSLIVIWMVSWVYYQYHTKWWRSLLNME